MYLGRDLFPKFPYCFVLSSRVLPPTSGFHIEGDGTMWKVMEYDRKS